MKRCHFLSLFIFLCFTLSSQERISNFTSEGSSNDSYLRTYEDVNYFLSVDQNNLLSVYQLTDQANKQFLHAQTFQGLYDQEGDIEFKDNYMVFPTAEEIVDYDFVNDITNSAKLPDDYYFSSFTGLINTSENRFPVSIKSLEQTGFRGMIYEIGGKTYELDNLPFHLYGDVLFDSRYNADDDTRIIYFENYVDNVIDTVGNDIDFSQYPAEDNNHIYYFNNEGELYSYDKTSRESNGIADIKLEKIGFSNGIIVHNNDLVLISSSSDTSIIQHYDKSSLEIKNIFRFDLDGEKIFASQVKMIDGVFTAIVDRELFILDLSTGEHFVRPTNYFWRSNFEILDDRFIINPYGTSNQIDISDRFELIDLVDMTTSAIDGIFQMDQTYNVGFAKFGSTYLTAFKYRFRESNTLFDIDIEAKYAKLNQDLDPSDSGLSSESSLFKLNNEIYLIGPSLYQIKGKVLDPIFPIEDIQEVNYQPINIQDDIIVFVQNDPKIIYSYDGITLFEEADLSGFQSAGGFTNSIDKFVITDDVVIFTDFFGDLYRYEKASKEIVHLEDHPNSSFETILHSHNGKIYFSGDDKLYTTDGYNYNLVLENYAPSLSTVSNNLISFKDHLFVYADGAFVSIDQDDNTEEISSGFDAFFGLFVIDKSGNNLLMGDDEKKIHYDGSNYFQFDLEYGGSFSPQGSNDNVFFFKENNAGDIVKTFFNSQTKIYSAIPEEIQQYDIIDYFVSNGEAFLLMKSGFNPYDRLYVYKTDENFTYVELIHEYLDVGWVGSASFSKYYNEGFLYTGDLLFLMNKQNEFIPFEDIKGDSQAYVEEKDGDTYFIALDAIHGRQLYTSSLISFQVDTKEVDLNKQNLDVYPNPSVDFLSIDNNANFSSIEQNSVFKIFGVNGELLIKGNTSALIDISQLPPGSYLLIVQTDSETRQTKFIKQ